MPFTYLSFARAWLEAASSSVCYWTAFSAASWKMIGSTQLYKTCFSQRCFLVHVIMDEVSGLLHFSVTLFPQQPSGRSVINEPFSDAARLHGYSRCWPATPSESVNCCQPLRSLIFYFYCAIKQRQGLMSGLSQTNWLTYKSWISHQYLLESVVGETTFQRKFAFHIADLLIALDTFRLLKSDS